MKKCFLCYLFCALFSQSTIASQQKNVSLQEQIQALISWPQASFSKKLNKKPYEYNATIPLFKYVPELYDYIPHVSLGTFPTPLKKLDRLGKFFNAKNLYIKNDSVSGNLFGGNKVRKLEFILADALEQGASAVVAIGAAGSNHATATAIHAHQLGLKCYSLLIPQLTTSYLRRNLLLTHTYGGTIFYYPSKDMRNLGLRDLFLTYKQEHSSYPYFIPLGGSNLLGSLGFINAAFELKEQIEQGLMPEPDYIYVTWGSGGTVAGLAFGIKLAGLKSKIRSITSDGIAQEREQTTWKLIDEISSLLIHHIPSLGHVTVDPNTIEFNHSMIGPYSLISEQVARNVQCMYDTEGIKLDTTYTGKTCSILFQDLENKSEMREKTILLWNTFGAGDFSSIIKHVDYKNLPSSVHHFFENDVQEFDQGV